MTSAAKALPAVLERIDADLDKSLEPAVRPRAHPVDLDRQRLQGFLPRGGRVTSRRIWKASASKRPCARPPVIRWSSAKSNGATAPNSGPRVLFYGHYDVQPVDPLNLWNTPPFEPKIDTLPDGRKIILGRGACDDKGQFMTFVEALPRLQGGDRQAAARHHHDDRGRGGMRLEEPVRFRAHAMPTEFKRDLALVCDTGMWDPKTPLVTTSLRGLLYEEVTITCADRDLHSGLFGGAAANPIRVLARIIAALHDENGRVMVPGYLRRRAGAAGRHQGRPEGAQPHRRSNSSARSASRCRPARRTAC